MHIDDQTYQRNGKTYRRALLRNSYRKNGKVYHDTIANLSKCSQEEIDVMKFALKNKNALTALNITGEKVQTRQGMIVGAVWVLHQLAKRLGIEKALGRRKEAKLALWMVIAAVIGSVSRLSATRLAQSHAACDVLSLDGFCEDDLYGILDWLDENQNKIEDRLFKNRYKNKVPNLFLYDVTSSYFEGNKNELSEYGYNRDGKKGKKQIVIGLLTDDEGYPVSCEVFRGNTKDPQTFKNQIDKVAKRFGIQKVTFVGDRGMIKSAQISELSAEDYYITALTKPQIEKLLKSGTGNSLEKLIQTAQNMDSLTSALKAAVGPEMGENLIAANVREDGELVVICSASAWASRLRFEEVALLAAAAEAGFRATSLRVSVTQQ